MEIIIADYHIKDVIFHRREMKGCPINKFASMYHE